MTRRSDGRPVESAPIVDPLRVKEDQPNGPMNPILTHPVALISIGASAGGLEAVSQFLESLPEFPNSIGHDHQYAFVFIQHLEPHHKSLLVELLSHRTKLKVVEAKEGMALAGGTLHIIAPGDYLSLETGGLHLSHPPHSRGGRLPIDFWLNSVAKNFNGAKACIILSGLGSDGSQSLKII